MGAFDDEDSSSVASGHTILEGDPKENTDLEETEAKSMRRPKEEQHTTDVDADARAEEEPTLFDILNEEVSDDDDGSTLRESTIKSKGRG